MPYIVISVLVLGLAGCGTIKGTASGFLEGASQDLNNLSVIIRNDKD